MNFDFTEEQTMIMDGISRYVREEYDFDVRRIIKDSNDGYSKEVWRRFSELGWLSIPFDEVYGGFGGNPDDLASVMIELCWAWSDCAGHDWIVPRWRTVDSSVLASKHSSVIAAVG